MVFYADVFYFAIFTGRDILIEETSLLGDFCSQIRCGYPFRDRVIHDDDSSITTVHINHLNEMTAFLRGEISITEQIVFSRGFQDIHYFWSFNEDALKCAMQTTGCSEGDWMCFEAFAMQHIVRGPIMRPDFLSRVTGTSQTPK